MAMSADIFQSTLPIQGETELTYEVTEIKMEFQSTLPIQGETSKFTGAIYGTQHFNPLSLYRERPFPRSISTTSVIFQSTLPIQGETSPTPLSPVAVPFQSTLPIQGETIPNAYGCGIGEFQSTLPIQGETSARGTGYLPRAHFNPLSLYRERRMVY